MWLEEEKIYLNNCGEILEKISVSEKEDLSKEVSVEEQQTKKVVRDVADETYEILSKIDKGKLAGREGLNATAAMVKEMNEAIKRKRRTEEEAEMQPTERTQSLAETMKRWKEHSNNEGIGQISEEEQR